MLKVGDIVEYIYNDGKKDLTLGIVIDVDNSDGHYEDEYTVLWFDDDEANTVCNGYSRKQLIKVSEWIISKWEIL